MTVREAFRCYPAVVFCAIAMSLTIVMEGYDTILISTLFAYPSFAAKYGTFSPKVGDMTISRPWEVGLGNAADCGSIIGLVINGSVTERYGHYRVAMVDLAVLAGLIFITFFAPTIEVLTAGKILVEFPWGIFGIIGSAYSSEICLLPLRGYLLSFVNICWVIGRLIAASVLQGLVNNTTVWAFRIPFAIQWAWPIPLSIWYQSTDTQSTNHRLALICTGTRKLGPIFACFSMAWNLLVDIGSAVFHIGSQGLCYPSTISDDFSCLERIYYRQHHQQHDGAVSNQSNEGKFEREDRALLVRYRYLVTAWAIFRLPEIKGRTYEELDVQFERRTKAWRFRRTEVDVIAETEDIQIEEKKMSVEQVHERASI